MSDELATPNEQETAQTVSLEDYNAMIAERDALKANNESLIGEKRSATQKAADLEKQTQEAKEAHLKKEGDFDALQKLTQEKADRYDSKLAEIEAKEKASKIKLASTEIGSELGADPKAAKLLTRFAADYVSVNDEGDIEYRIDGITVDKNKLTEFLSSECDRLVAGVKSNGGGATGGDNASSNTNTAAQDAKKKGDLNGFLNASFNKK